MTSILSLARRGNRNLSIVASRDPPASADSLYARYCADHTRWHCTKSQRDQSVLLESYRKFVVAHLGEADARPLVALVEQRWGGAA